MNLLSSLIASIDFLCMAWGQVFFFCCFLGIEYPFVHPLYTTGATLIVKIYLHLSTKKKTVKDRIIFGYTIFNTINLNLLFLTI